VGLCATIRSARNVALEWRRRVRYCWIRDVRVFSIGVRVVTSVPVVGKDAMMM